MPTTIHFLLVNNTFANINILITLVLTRQVNVSFVIFDKLFIKLKMKFIEFVELCFIQSFTHFSTNTHTHTHTHTHTLIFTVCGSKIWNTF